MWIALVLLILLVLLGVAGATGVGVRDTRDPEWTLRSTQWDVRRDESRS